MSRRKRSRAYYLYEDQIEKLEKASGNNPSRFLRMLLDEIFASTSEANESSVPYGGQ